MDEPRSTRPRVARRLHAVVARRPEPRGTRPRAASKADPAVDRLQQRLNQLEYRDAAGRALPVDGVFGARTEEALIEFQRAHGLRADGLAGPRTLAALYPPDAGIGQPPVVGVPVAG